MLRVIVPVARTVVTGVNTRMGNTTEPTPLEPRVIEVKVAAVTMAGAASCWVPRSVEVENENTPAPIADPRVKPDSVTVCAAVLVGLPPILRISLVLVEAAFVPVIPAIVDAPAAKEGKGVAPKYPSGVLIVMKPSTATEAVGVNTRTGNTAEPTPLEPRVIELKVAAATMAGAASCWVPRSAEVANKKTPGLAAADPRVKPDSVTVTAVVPVGWAPIVRMS